MQMEDCITLLMHHSLLICIAHPNIFSGLLPPIPTHGNLPKQTNVQTWIQSEDSGSVNSYDLTSCSLQQEYSKIFSTSSGVNGEYFRLC